MKIKVLMMKKNQILLLLIGVLFFYGCNPEKAKKIILVKNTLSIDRNYETIELSKSFLNVDDLSLIGIKDLENGETLITQFVDTDNDGTVDQILFQPKIKSESEKEYEIITLSDDERPKSINYCFSRFVPERTDDYTWENDKVAFRVYGPVAQKMAEDNVKGGTLSSGVDAWLKRVDYPIINKWYKEHLTNPGSYHKDSGEGLDNFHVGISRGVGGIAIKNEGKYYYSKNYTKWRTITTGPLRTSFYLEYENWDANGNEITESKIISLDFGSNLSKFETSISGTNTIAAGLTLHEKDGEVSASNENGWVSYWQPHKESEIATSIVTKKEYFLGYEKFDTEAIDESNAYLNLNVIDNKVTYYAGFTWKKSKQFKDRKAWEIYLDNFSKKINTPLIVEIAN
jgi:hypothetical protein